MDKRAKATVDLMPELIKRVAMLVKASKDMLSLLQALPAEWLTKPLAALRKRCAHPAPRGPGGRCLWPRLQLPYEITDPELRAWMATAL
ncbi:hypothetical protein SDRG_07822 [Saprolegnia diclina VS20]|uniref:Uncharacterized protein n=1 Tax=Saprolegnia diclina (strain VS20) TaxID=1156394 RepID=T0Q9E7_SAPDV|nr:hypothetical protein SDRG_07822 [Saprolegnia diclina VS20]EQC34494.1 hypothetical protein SDRG_07822 [Saprolegnia diclina VS20]|eukprot:XP_008611900.1 hypothetical protein SDRG_07822 [Saprolegnia diclina VS20]